MGYHPQAGIIVANQKLTKHLAKYGYTPTNHTTGLWKYKQCPITFSLVVNNFGVKYIGKAHVQYLLDAIGDLYSSTTDWEGTLYCGITLRWNYAQRTVDISMPGYVEAALHIFQHPNPSRPQHAPNEWIPP
jgi:hypothetical protein